jgi:hypothetical protein
MSNATTTACSARLLKRAAWPEPARETRLVYRQLLGQTQIGRLHESHAGIRSQKTKPSRSTTSPVAHAIGSVKIGPA